MASISALVTELNELLPAHEFARFLLLRKSIQGKSKLSRKLFNPSKKSVNESNGWAFHSGGAGELQFNLAFEGPEWEYLRVGIAISLEKSRSFSKIDSLLPKIARLNEYIRYNQATVNDYVMWIEGRQDKLITGVRQILEGEQREGNFIFLGKLLDSSTLNLTEVLDIFEKFIETYEFVETGVLSNRLERDVVSRAFLFQERFTVGPLASAKKVSSSSINVTLRSNQLKAALRDLLLSISPTTLLGDEIPSGNEGRIDVVAKVSSGHYHFYEIKPAMLARHAIREALPQLLEYSYRVGGKEAEKLVVVSNAPLDIDSAAFLAMLRSKGLPIFYLHLALKT